MGAQQAAAVPLFKAWWEARLQGKAPRPFFYLAGYGGTGKTFLAERLAREVGLASNEIGGGAMQANAAHVLNRRTGWTCQTMHRWLCLVQSIIGGPTWFALNPDSPARQLALFVVDEMSLVPPHFWQALLALEVPVLALGDPGQIGAISGASVGRALQPDVFLTDIHRQAEGNPIIAWSLAARQGVPVPYGEYADASGVVRMRKLPMSSASDHDLANADVVLVWKNETRRRFNTWFRAVRGWHGLPQRDEPMVCLKNQSSYGLVNGFNARVLEEGRARGDYSYTMTVQVAETGVIVPNRACLKRLVAPVQRTPPPFLVRELSEFDFGYCKTVNKFIGDQADRVVLFDERPDSAETHSWRYVGMSRAASHLTILTP